jgi:hypothetical protein
MHNSVRNALLCGATAATVGCFSTVAWSAVITQAQIKGVFSNPVYTGSVLNTPAVGQKTFFNNSATAPSATSISPDGSTLQWGTNVPISPGTNYSLLKFTGATVPLKDMATPIQLGAITFSNGTSALNSLIFGATLTFSLDGISLGSDQVLITTTSNQSSGLFLTPAQAQLDADYINICGNSSNICSTGIQAFENTQGEGGVAFSTPLVAGLYGTYAIDPGVTLTKATYIQGDGVVTGRVSVAPEPSTWAMMILGFAGLGFAGYRKAKNGKTALSAA